MQKRSKAKQNKTIESDTTNASQQQFETMENMQTLSILDSASPEVRKAMDEMFVQNNTALDNALKVGENTVQIGNQTITNLDAQGKQIAHIRQGLEHISNQAEEAKVDAKKTRHAWYQLLCCCLPSSKKKSKHGSDDDEMQISVPFKFQHLSGSTSNVTGAKSTEAKIAIEDEKLNNIDNLLDVMGGQAKTMNHQLTTQNKMLDSVNKQANKTDVAIQKADKAVMNNLHLKPN